MWGSGPSSLLPYDSVSGSLPPSVVMVISGSLPTPDVLVLYPVLFLPQICGSYDSVSGYLPPSVVMVISGSLPTPDVMVLNQVLICRMILCPFILLHRLWWLFSVLFLRPDVKVLYPDLVRKTQNPDCPYIDAGVMIENPWTTSDEIFMRWFFYLLQIGLCGPEKTIEQGKTF
jgi:hypothetical protein